MLGKLADYSRERKGGGGGKDISVWDGCGRDRLMAANQKNTYQKTISWGGKEDGTRKREKAPRAIKTHSSPSSSSSLVVASPFSPFPP